MNARDLLMIAANVLIFVVGISVFLATGIIIGHFIAKFW
jgi:uncharacterized protein YneF (UPF0154 family)